MSRDSLAKIMKVTLMGLIIISLLWERVMVKATSR